MADGKKLQSNLKKLGVNNIPGIEEVCLFFQDEYILMYWFCLLIVLYSKTNCWFIEQKTIEDFKWNWIIGLKGAMRHLSYFFCCLPKCGKSLNAFSPKLKFLGHAIFKVLELRINNFSVTSVLQFCQYCDGRLAFGKLA